MHQPPLPPGTGLSLPIAMGALLRPPELLHPRLNRHLGRRVEPLAGERRPPRLSQAPSRPGSRRSGPAAGNPEILEFALSQEMREQRRSFPRRRAGRRILCFLLFLFHCWSKGQQYPLSQRKSNFLFLRVLRSMDEHPASSLSPTTHLASSQESAVRGRNTSPRTSSQSHLGPREFGKDTSERAAFCTIQPYSPLLHLAHAAQPVSLAHTHNSTRLGDSVCQATSQVQRVLETSVAVRNVPVLREEIAVLLAKDAIEPVPPAEMRQGFYSPYFIVPKKGGGL